MKNVTRFERALKYPENDETMPYMGFYVAIKRNSVIRTSFKNVDIPWASITTGMKRLTANTHVANQHEIGAAWVVRFAALVFFLFFFLLVLKITFNIYLHSHIYTHTHIHTHFAWEGRKFLLHTTFYFIIIWWSRETC